MTKHRVSVSSSKRKANDMPKIRVPKLSEVREAKPVPEGEYELRIQSVDEKDSQAGKPMLAILHVIESSDYPDAAPVMHYLSLPDEEEDDEKALNFKSLQIARYCQLFGIEIPEDDELDTEDFEGKTANCNLIQEPFSDDSDEMVNRIKMPRLRSEDEEEEESPRRGGKKPAAKPAKRKAAPEPEEEEEAEEEPEEEETEEEEEAEAEEVEEEEEDERPARPAKRAPARKPEPAPRKGRR